MIGSTAGFGLGLSVSLLINCVICGYLLVNTRFLQKRLPLTYGTSDFFRILLFGCFCAVVATASGRAYPATGS